MNAVNDRIVRVSYTKADGTSGFRYRNSETAAKKLQERLTATGATNFQILFRGQYQNGKYNWD